MKKKGSFRVVCGSKFWERLEYNLPFSNPLQFPIFKPDTLISGSMPGEIRWLENVELVIAFH